MKEVLQLQSGDFKCSLLTLKMKYKTINENLVNPKKTRLFRIHHIWWILAPGTSRESKEPEILTNPSHLGCRGDDGLQRCGGTWGVTRVTAGVLCAVVMVVVSVGGGALQQLLPAWRRFRLGIEGGGGGQRSRWWRWGGGGAHDWSHPAEKAESGLDLSLKSWFDQILFRLSGSLGYLIWFKPGFSWNTF